MKIIFIFILANLGFVALSRMDDLARDTKRKLQNYVDKYRYLSTGNAEFAQWIEKLYNAIHSKRDVVWKTRLRIKFGAYDKERQELEDQITTRLSRVKTQLSLRDGGQGCVPYYTLQKSALENAYQLSNYMKKDTIKSNSYDCPSNIRQKSYDYDDY
ncbi:uncharacterized protein LOC108033507 [Drosophila biarmipes]|uniref:uncharacterized protein LOC108033507 n=1 Tax=Drosophila biarmipes TaxID=125945 RepID=UPI0007E5F003|nr:uncharacterized protein LOC108033507 [Drosophila biarmipes]